MYLDKMDVEVVVSADVSSSQSQLVAVCFSTGVITENCITLPFGDQSIALYRETKLISGKWLSVSLHRERVPSFTFTPSISILVFSICSLHFLSSRRSLHFHLPIFHFSLHFPFFTCRQSPSVGLDARPAQLH